MTATQQAMTEPAEAAALGRVPDQLFIGGSWHDAEGGRRFAVEDPATGAVLREIADASPLDSLAALHAAAAAQTSWAATPPRERSDILRRAFDAVTARAEEFALLITLEMGKPLAESRAEVAYGAEFLRWFSEEAVRIGGGYQVAPHGATRLLTMKQPVGPCLLITPWNFPLAMGTRKIGPAVAAGCTMVVKPAPQTPLTMLALADVLAEAGLPAGVLNVVTTTAAAEITEALITDPRLRKLSFTGSTAVGSALVAQSAKRLLRVSMELGGNAPFLVFDDADLDAAVEGAMLAKMRNAGEACTAANRFLVHTSVAEEFSHRLADRMFSLTVGRGTEQGVQVGPLIDASARKRVDALVKDAVARGSRLLTGGGAVGEHGHFYAPTVLADIPADAQMLSEEIFGPVAPVTRFTEESEALQLANGTDAGLVAYVFTRDLSRALRVCEGLETGMVGLNQGLVSNPAAPFGGVKSSGLGREGGAQGIDEYLEVKYVGIQH
ncbi:NAD-dependent succinate-semialdehyde dehydrogenase [Streptomyces sp. NPDC048479]|uniref:NAD-dependent succinate-semialdehyde dehydrogenase n=1 Tax=Streptomyces sp. NPDC048479 TaxID=3154725 RepID=UPI0034471F4F